MLRGTEIPISQGSGEPTSVCEFPPLSCWAQAACVLAASYGDPLVHRALPSILSTLFVFIRANLISIDLEALHWAAYCSSATGTRKCTVCLEGPSPVTGPRGQKEDSRHCNLDTYSLMKETGAKCGTQSYPCDHCVQEDLVLIRAPMIKSSLWCTVRLSMAKSLTP